MASAVSPSTPARTAPAGEGRPVVACQALTKVFKDFWLRDRARAVDNLDLTIAPHEIFGLLGPNGSGKSTTIKLILGLLRPSSGRVSVFGKSPTDVSTKRRIGYLPEESYLYPFLNARETLDYYGRLFELDGRTRERRIDELLEMVGLTHAQFRPVREYSKGMQRRIGLAQALINDPDLLILDEPTTGLDPLGTRQVKDLIIELGRRGKTVILSSHLLSDVEDCVDRMVILYGGKIRGQGTCEQLLEVHDKTTIETDSLDDATITEIDRIIRERSGGLKAVRGVHAPRQKLEELFLGIVERARAERLVTSGVANAGATAAFLRAEERTGESLIEDLVNAAEPAPEAPDQPAPPPVSAEEPSTGVIDELVAGPQRQDDEPTVPAPSPRSTPRRQDPGEPDQDVIGSLIDEPDEPRGGTTP